MKSLKDGMFIVFKWDFQGKSWMMAVEISNSLLLVDFDRDRKF